MPEKHPLTLGALIATETLACFGVPGGSTVSTIIGGYLEGRRKEAMGILIEEIAAGDHENVAFLPEDVDPFIEIIHRFSKAIEDGTAITNLRLLAQVIAGEKKNKALDPDHFRKWASILADMTRSELVLVGNAIRVMEQEPENYWQTLIDQMIEGNFEEDEIQALTASVARTGLLLPVSAYGGLIYKPSPWLHELSSLVRCEDLTG